MTPQLIELVSQLAGGGVGLIITGHAYVQRHGQHSPRQLGINRDELIDGLKQMSAAVHEKGGKIVVQLGYGGAYLSKSRLRRLTVELINEIINAYARAAKRAKTAGFDGIQILAAHGFLLSQFLCPRYNDRADAYGGNIENRSRVLLEVLAAVRQATGMDYPVMVKINCQDFTKGGLTEKDSLWVAQMLEKRGADAIELSGGLLNNPNALSNNIDPEKNKAYFRDEAKTFKQKIKVPLILVGGIRSYTVAEKLINDGTADYISMSRPFIREPDLVKRWQSGKLSNAACISCNNCIEPAKAGKGISCVPIEAIPEITFFPQEVRRIPAGFPHKKGSSYLITKGLDQRDSMFIPMIKVELEYEGVISPKSLSFPLNGDDYEKVNMTISELLGKIP